MSRVFAVAGLLLGWVVLLGSTASLPAQQFRNLPQNKPAPAAPLQNNFNNARFPQNQKVVGFNVANPANQGNAGPNGAAGGTANAIINAMNNGGLGTQNFNPYNSGYGPGYNPYNSGYDPGYNPYYNNATLNPVHYNTMMYGTPYGYPMNPYYSYYNPYQFLGTGTVAGMSGGPTPGYPSPAQLYNFNLNYQYLANPYLNSLSNPAFSGPFPAGVFNSTAALNILGFSNILQSLPLNPNPGSSFGTGNSTFP